MIPGNWIFFLDEDQRFIIKLFLCQCTFFSEKNCANIEEAILCVVTGGGRQADISWNRSKQESSQSECSTSRPEPPVLWFQIYDQQEETTKPSRESRATTVCLETIDHHDTVLMCVCACLAKATHSLCADPPGSCC